MEKKSNESMEKLMPHDVHGDGDSEDGEWSCTDSEDDSCFVVDLDDDPSYDPLEDEGRAFSALSITKPSMTSAGGKPVADGRSGSAEGISEKKTPCVGERDIVGTVRVLVEGGQLEKLKVEECKDYLRRNGLRLTGNKETLLQRIREHYEMMDGEGERKYPRNSFVINCQGDACIGDVVMFEQNVYDLYSIVSRSAAAPSCGKRLIVGRIVKESYGARKQQHTFTIEVLWSKGKKPLPTLHPLLIKGRNLYRFQTLRQRWEDEDQRRRILMEKHSRGDVARSDREARIQEKERRKTIRANSMRKASQAKIRPEAEVKADNKDPRAAVLETNSSQTSRLMNPQDCHGKTMIRHHLPVSAQEVHPAKAYPTRFQNPAHTQCHLSSHYLKDRWTSEMPNNHRRNRQLCRYFEQGRCYFGDNCKFLHQYRDNFDFI